MIKPIIQSTRADCEGVPLLRRHQDLPPPGGDHLATVAAGPVLSVRHHRPVVVEVGVVVLPGVNTGQEAVADPPVPGLRHSKDACAMRLMLTRECYDYL